MSNKEQPVVRPIYEAIGAWMDTIDRILFALQQPVNNPKKKQDELKTNLKIVVKEAIEGIQLQLLRSAQDGTSLFLSDPTGFTKANSTYGSEAIGKKFRFAYLVNQYCEEVLKEQEASAAAEGIGISAQQLVNVAEDINDADKKEVVVEASDPETGEASRLVIDKETGDTQLEEKDKETGMWKKVGNKMKGWFTDVKDFFGGIFKWCCKQWSRFAGWFKGLFKTPEESEVRQAS